MMDRVVVLVLLGYGGGGGGCGVVDSRVVVLVLGFVTSSTLASLVELGWAFLLAMMVEWVFWRLGPGVGWAVGVWGLRGVEWAFWAVVGPGGGWAVVGVSTPVAP